MTKHLTPIFTMIAIAMITLAGMAGMARTADAKEAVIGLSPSGTKDEKLADTRAIAFYVAETLEPGETAWVVDALNMRQIAQFTVSEDPALSDGIKARMRANGPFFAGMKTFAEAARPPEGEAFAGQIDPIGFFRMVGRTYATESPRDLILYNVSPIAHDPRTPAFSMQAGAVPDDASIAASRADNLYGAAGEADLLANYTVYWGANGTDWSQSDRHQYYLERFLALSVQARGGVLASFAGVPETALMAARAGHKRPVGDFALEPDDQPTMVTYHVAETATDEDASGSIYERALSGRAASAAELAAARDVEIAIRWSCDCDFDLAVQPAGAEAISFRKRLTDEGVLFKDYLSSESLNLGWETVSLPGPVDLTALTVAIDLFRGSAGAEVELRIAIGNETWGRRFVTGGNADGGKGFTETLRRKTPANPAWIVVDPLALLGGA